MGPSRSSKVEEVRKIWDLPDSEERSAALILLYTGMRVGELSTVSEVHEHYLIAGEKKQKRAGTGRYRYTP